VALDHLDYSLVWRAWNVTDERFDAPEVLQNGTGNGGGERRTNLGATGAMKFVNTSQGTGDTEVSVKLLPADGWAPGGAASIRTIASRWNTSAGTKGWIFYLDETGHLCWKWSADGSAELGPVMSTAAVPFEDATAGSVRVLFDVNNGAAGNTATFSTSDDDGATWTVLGDPVVTAGTTTISTTTFDYRCGAHNNTSADFLNGSVYWVDIRIGSGLLPQVPWLLDDWDQATTAASVAFVGAPVIIALAGAASGQNIVYFDDASRRYRLNQPHGQDLVFLSTGHNESDTQGAYVAAYAAWVANVKTRVPGAAIVPVSQNPATAPQSQQVIDQRATRSAAIMSWAEGQGGVYPLDTYEAFTDPTSQVESSDGTHPTQGNGGTSGSDVWAAYVYSRLFI
jgi:hypothetical protein